MAQHIAKDSFYKERLYAVSVTSWGDDDKGVTEKRRQKELSRNPMSKEVITAALGNFGKTAAGPHYHYLSFIAPEKNLNSVAGIEDFEHLQYVDVSKNNLITLKPLSNLKYMTFLNASHNKLSKLLDLKDIPLTLEVVNCSNNEISVIPDLSKHRFLKKLDLSNNKISKIEGVLKLAHNAIENIENLDGMNLTELNLRGNQIKIITGLSQLPNLRILNLSSNHIKKLNGLIDLVALRELWLSDNKIFHVRQLYYVENLSFLSVLDLCYNKIQTRRYYRFQVLYRLPGLRILDGVHSTPEEFVKAENLYGLDLEDRRRIFKEVLPEEEFIDRRINIAELIEPETESDNEEELQFVDKYNKQGQLVHSNSQVRSHKSSRRTITNDLEKTHKSSASIMNDTQRKLLQMRAGSFDIANRSQEHFTQRQTSPQDVATEENLNQQSTGKHTKSLVP